ncbi:hypothetical protein SDC9_163394 [bioreactor metagenome]|uniref:Uncharacterized protein n=1 Tax=bioreactor metagenome TaxID=1076179 RepID=A0A645FQR8_9ZZZZ
MLETLVPCIPTKPVKRGEYEFTAPHPIKDVQAGLSMFSKKVAKSSEAFALITPPPT